MLCGLGSSSFLFNLLFCLSSCPPASLCVFCSSFIVLLSLGKWTHHSVWEVCWCCVVFVKLLGEGSFVSVCVRACVSDVCWGLEGYVCPCSAPKVICVCVCVSVRIMCGSGRRYGLVTHLGFLMVVKMGRNRFY